MSNNKYYTDYMKNQTLDRVNKYEKELDKIRTNKKAADIFNAGNQYDRNIMSLQSNGILPVQVSLQTQIPVQYGLQPVIIQSQSPFGNTIEIVPINKNLQFGGSIVFQGGNQYYCFR